jgi:8-oxo-dGTP pyrophosphatase MutT (NUDIX family)
MTPLNTDNQAYRFPVSIKGVVIINGKVPLLKNERDEFELPGGKLEIQEQPVECVTREIKEELNLTVHVDTIIDSWLYTIKQNVHVVIITYGCFLTSNHEHMVISHEHKELFMASEDEIDSLNMPEGYKISIKKWFAKNSLQVLV